MRPWRRAASLASSVLNPGPHRLRWDGRDGSGQRVAAGNHFACFSTPGLASSARLVVLP